MDRLRITLAVAGFRRDQLEITLEDNQLIIRGRQEDDKAREFIHRGIAARQFSRSFVLADGIEVKSADLSDGLLCIDLVRREPDRLGAQDRDRCDQTLSPSGHSGSDRDRGKIGSKRSILGQRATRRRPRPGGRRDGPRPEE